MCVFAMQLFGDQIGTGSKFHTTRQAADLKHVNTCAESGTNADRPPTLLHMQSLDSGTAAPNDF